METSIIGSTKFQVKLGRREMKEILDMELNLHSINNQTNSRKRSKVHLPTCSTKNSKENITMIINELII